MKVFKAWIVLRDGEPTGETGQFTIFATKDDAVMCKEALESWGQKTVVRPGRIQVFEPHENVEESHDECLNIATDALNRISKAEPLADMLERMSKEADPLVGIAEEALRRIALRKKVANE